MFQPRQTQAQQPIDPTKPSKEYVYLGGRLIATEEGPGQGGGITPQSVGPTISSLSRTSAVPGESFTLTITGSHLTDCATTCATTGNVSFDPSSSAIALGTFTGSDTSLSGQVTLQPSVAEGNYLVTVRTANGADSKPFTIAQPAGPISISSDTSQIPVGIGAFTVALSVVNGGSFTSGSTVWLNGNLYASNSQFRSQTANQIVFDIRAADTATPRALDITVHTPISGSAENISNTVTINVVPPSGAPNPWPIIAGMSQISVNAGAQDFWLTVSATLCSVGDPLIGVNSHSLILINGVARSTTFPGDGAPCSIKTMIHAAEIAHPGALRVTVFNPAPGACALDGSGARICGLALNTLSLQITPATQISGHYSIALAGNAWVKVHRNAGAQINITGPLTVEAWIYPTRNNVRQAIVEKFNATPGTSNGGYGLRLNSNGTVSFTTYQSSLDFDSITSLQTISTNQWTHVAGVLDSSNQFRIYIAGIQDQNAFISCPTGLCRAPNFNDPVNLQIGGSPDGGSDGSAGFFSGNLDEIRVSNSAVYAGTSFPPALNLPAGTGVGLWKFDDQTFNDTSSANDQNDGVAKGGSIFFSSNTPDNPGGSIVSQDVGGGNSPALTFISQASAMQGDTIPQLKINGTNLSNNLKFTVDDTGTPGQGITVSSPSLNANGDQIIAQLAVGPLTAPGAYMVTVPGSDNTLIFTVQPIADNPSPSLSGAQLSQSSAQVGATPPTLTITNGINFVPGAIVRVRGSGQSQGSDRTTQPGNSTSVSFTLAQSDLEIPGQLSITVFNPPNSAGKGGGESPTALPFQVAAQTQNPQPTLNSVCVLVGSICSSTVQNGTTGTLRVVGASFIGSSQIVYHGAPRPDTRFVSSAELDLTLSSADTTNLTGQPLQIPVTVNTPPPGGGEAAPPLQLTVTSINPIPTISSLAVNGAAPNITAGGPQFTLQVLGTNFVGIAGQPPVSVVKVNGNVRTTTYVSSTQLNATVLQGDIQSVGQIEISVFTPSPGGGTSDPMLLTVEPASNPQPTVSSVSPTRAQVDQTSSQVGKITVTGNGFMTGSRVLVDGFPRTTDPFSQSDPTHLYATLLDSDFAVLGQLQVEVSNPEPGGGTSNAKPLAVYAPVPTLNPGGISPSSATAGPNPVTITLTGTNFIDESTVLVNNVSRPASVVPGAGGTQLNATLTSDVASGAVLNIQVSNPTTGGGGGTSSTTLNFTVNNPQPALDQTTPLTPATVTAGTGNQTISVFGSGFVPTSTVTINGTNRATYINPNHLNVSILASDIPSGGTIPITVFNPAPPSGGLSSATVNLTINNPPPTLDPNTPLTPATVYVCSGSQSITVLGTGFVPTSQVMIGQTNRATFVDPTHLTVSIQAADLTTAGQIPITVFNPAPPAGGLSSTKIYLQVNNPLPTLSGLSRVSATQGESDAPFNINVLGTNFVSNSTVQFNPGGINHPALPGGTCGSLTIQITPADLSTVTQYTVTVINPAPGGGTSPAPSPAVTFNVTAPPPNPAVVSSISPTVVTVGANPAPPVTVNGSGFVVGPPSSVVVINGASHPPDPGMTTTKMVIHLSGDDVSAPAGAYPVTVVNPNGAVSNNNVTLTLVNPVPPGTSISPAAWTTGYLPQPGPSSQLTITGPSFVIGSTPQASTTVTIGSGAPHFVLFPQSTTTQLVIQLTSADVSTAGSPTVYVTNPGGGNPTSVGTWNIINAPQVSTISPNSGTVGNGDTNAAVTGTGFILPGSVVMLNGATHNPNPNAQSCTNSATQLCITLRSDPDLDATAGVYPITVVTTTPGGVSNSNVAFTLNNPVLSMGSLSLSSVVVGSGPQTITANGTGFVPATTVIINGQNRATYVSPTQVQVSILAGETATAGTIPITAVNAPPGGGSGTLNFTINNPTPSITSLSPSSATVGGAAFTLTVNGTNFVSGATVRVNGNSRTTTFVSATQLTASIPASDIASAGTLSITVANPAPTSSASTAATFTVNNPVPTISSLSPNSATAGGAAFTLTVNGTNFVSGATVRVNGNSRTTTFVSATQLTASIPASDIASAGTLSVTVANPAPTSSASTAATFTVNNPVPTISSLSPNSATAGGAAFTLTVNGTNFVSGATVRVNGNSRTTTFVSATQLTASIPAGDIASAGTLSVTVVNPTPGGGVSSAFSLTVNSAAPVISGLSPQSVAVGGPNFTLTISGSNFVNGATVQLNDLNGTLSDTRNVTFISSTQLTVQMFASDIASADTIYISVVNPANSGNGGTSNTAAMSVH